MIAQWENECISLSAPLGPVFNPRSWQSISRDFPWLITLFQLVLSQGERETAERASVKKIIRNTYDTDLSAMAILPWQAAG